MFCLDCMLKHLRDFEHHLEDAVRVTKGETKAKFEAWLDDARMKRKEILQMIKKGSNPMDIETSQGCGCEGIVNPGELNPKELEVCTWREEKVKPKEEFEPESFRTLCPECPDARCAKCPPELACATRIIIGCPLGQWDPETKRCKVSTQTHTIYHGHPANL